MSSVPLLGAKGGGGGGGGEADAARSPSWLGRVVDTAEASAQLRFAVPMVLTSMAFYGIPLVSVMFSGHLGDVHLAGATLGNSWATVTGYAFVVSRALPVSTRAAAASAAGEPRGCAGPFLPQPDATPPPSSPTPASPCASRIERPWLLRRAPDLGREQRSRRRGPPPPRCDAALKLAGTAVELADATLLFSGVAIRGARLPRRGLLGADLELHPS